MIINYFTRKRILIETLCATQVLESASSIPTMNAIKESAKTLKFQMQDVSYWLLKDNSGARDIKEQIIRIFEKLTGFCVDVDVTLKMDLENEKGDAEQT